MASKATKRPPTSATAHGHSHNHDEAVTPWMHPLVKYGLMVVVAAVLVVVLRPDILQVLNGQLSRMQPKARRCTASAKQPTDQPMQHGAFLWMVA
jgi:hypothetical protein